MVTSNYYNRSFWNAMRGKAGAYTEMAEGADGGGAYVSPSESREKFNAALAKDNVFRRFGTVIHTSSPEGFLQAVVSTGSADWVQEGMPITESSDTFMQFFVKSYKLGALTRIKESFVNDMDFDLEHYLLNEFARRFGRKEEAACISGDGELQPAGILADTGAEIGVTTANATSISYDEMVRLYFSLKAEYRPNAVFLMNDETAMTLRTVRDAAGNLLWNSSNDTIFSKPVVTSPNMPTISAGSKAILFGDLSYYWMIERQPLTIKRLNELFAIDGQIGFFGFERLDGKLIRPEAAKALKIA